MGEVRSAPAAAPTPHNASSAAPETHYCAWYFNGATKNQSFKRRRSNKYICNHLNLSTAEYIRCKSIAGSRSQAWSVSENTKFVAEEGSSQEGNHSWVGSAPFICQQKSAGKYRLPYCQQKIEMPFFFLGREFILQWLVSSGDKHHLKEEEMPCFGLLLGDGFVHLNSS